MRFSIAFISPCPPSGGRKKFRGVHSRSQVTSTQNDLAPSARLIRRGLRAWLGHARTAPAGNRGSAGGHELRRLPPPSRSCRVRRGQPWTIGSAGERSIRPRAGSLRKREGIREVIAEVEIKIPGHSRGGRGRARAEPLADEALAYGDDHADPGALARAAVEVADAPAHDRAGTAMMRPTAVTAAFSFCHVSSARIRAHGAASCSPIFAEGGRLPALAAGARATPAGWIH